MSASRRSLALGMLVATMIVWGSTFVITKAAAQDIAPMMLATLRFCTAAIVLLPYAWLKGNWQSLPRPLPWGALFGMALTGIATFTIAFNYALVYGSASQGALIYALVPAAVAVAAVLFLKERMSKLRIAGIVLSIAGVGLVALGGESDSSSPQPLLGAIWMIGAVLSWAAYTIFAKRLADADQAVTIALVSVLGTLMLVPLAAIELSHAPWHAPSRQAWVGVAFLGVAASALAYIAYGYALRELEASLVGAFINLDPLVGVLTAVLFLGETLRSGQMLGGVIALAGMWLASSGEN